MRKSLALLIIALLASLVSMNAAFAEQRERVDICHYNEYGGYWELITPNANSTNMHFANHDDAVPGGYTTKTNTLLDEYCNPGLLPSCGNCLVEREGTGCEEQNCEAIIASIDPWCVEVSWDDICVEEALELCVDVVCAAD